MGSYVHFSVLTIIHMGGVWNITFQTTWKLGSSFHCHLSKRLGSEKKIDTYPISFLEIHNLVNADG